MSGRVVKFDLSEIDEAIGYLKETKELIKERSEQLVEELANEGAMVADTIFQSVPSTEQGSSSTITVEGSGGSRTIKAIGEGVAFIEFGTGVSTAPYQYEKSSIPIGMDEWSKRNSMQFHEKGYWYYGGQRMDGTPAYRPMITASRRIKNIAESKARKVFGQ